MTKPESSKEQQIVKVNQLIENADYDFIISTYGSTFKLGNSSLGPSGAAAVIYTKEDTHNAADIKTSKGQK